MQFDYINIFLLGLFQFIVLFKAYNYKTPPKSHHLIWSENSLYTEIIPHF